MIPKFSWVLITLVLLASATLQAQEKTQTERVRIAIATSSLAFLVPFVAKDRGFYLKHGSEVELIVMRPNIAMAALLGGDIDYAELIGSVIRSAARGLPVRAISTGIKAPFFSIVAQNKYKSVKELKGTVIGVASIGGTNQISTRITLRQFGLDPDKDIKFLAIGDERLMYDTFKFGRVDSIAVAPPYSVQLKREGYPLLAHTSDYVTIPFSGLGTTIERIKNNRAQVKKLLRAEIEALRFIQSNAAGTAEVIRKRFSMDEKLARESYDVVVNAFSRDGRVPLDGVDILLQIEKDAKQIPATVTPQMIVDLTLVDETLKEMGGK
ncbi:MAG TPA: ABC transporter substrate-binding protein [Candidatus Limnocylindrales bacterium]|nr:ABC transporter substrate-binding protein [Candidatus Limnocylindrales bacterium]